ncbi:fumarylacetoacetate hydrolase family protein [Intrasporangium flavum]|uniref:fumarylacetoacetate hydrolase family protein n=1 Tax=Intrasporangium flavum TaxID=1428657 RepID=UPI00096D67D4|nr:fumarylacetoacetate hydrolase family protein [Intrasporangium flavum]
MRLARIGAPGRELPVVEARDGTLLDLTPLTHDVDAAFLERLSATGGSVVRDAVRAGRLSPVPEGASARFGPPVARPGKVVGIGLNYRCHAAAIGAVEPAEPVVFLKASTSVCGPDDTVRLLDGSTTTDHEVELAVVVGRVLRRASPGEALDAVAGYALADDLTDRTLQLGGAATWTPGKCADTYCPLGPWLVLPDAMPAPDGTGVRLRLEVNGVRRQDGWTDDMVHDVAACLAHVSTLMTLEPGDVVITGTPAGVAMAAAEPRPYLRDGDVVEADGGALGRQRSPIAAARHTVGHETTTKESAAWLSTR